MDKIIQKQLESLDRKLEVMLVLMAHSVLLSDDTSLREKIRLLDSFGLRIPEIAQALNKKVGYISKELSLIRKGK